MKAKILLASILFASLSAQAAQVSVGCKCWVRTEKNQRWVYAGHAYGAGATTQDADQEALYQCTIKPFAHQEKVIEAKTSCATTSGAKN